MSLSPPGRLAAAFANVESDSQTPVWDKVWQQGVTPWDRNGPSEALREAVIKYAEMLQLEKNHNPETAQRALVPGCGSGYDVALLSSFSYHAFGLDVSPTPHARAKKLFADGKLLNEKYPVFTPSANRGEMEFVLGDFFTDDAFTQTGGAKFDIIFDYTFLCALPPAMRPNWARQMSELLAPTGHLICLEFPLKKDPSTGGPPHGLTPELYGELFKQPGSDVRYGSDGRVIPEPEREIGANGLELCARWKPKHTHAAGQDSDHVSIWRHVQR